MSGRGVRTGEEAEGCCAALFVQSPSGPKGAQGTVTFLEHAGMCLGITNQHVTGPAGGNGFYVSLQGAAPLPGAVPLPGRLIMTSARDNPDLPLDMALFLLDEEAIIRGGKAPYPLAAGAPPVTEGSRLMAVGYHGTPARTRAVHVTGTCVGASDRRIILHDGLSGQTHQPSFGGMSGGPMFALGEDGLFRLAGVIYQGRGLGDGGGDIWIYGFPVHGGLMDRALELADRA